jgi:hypothetical protein
MAQTLQYWTDRWENSAQRSPGRIALELFREYASFFTKIPILKRERAYWGGLGRFFAGRWDTNHGGDVQDAIGDFFTSGSNFYEHPSCCKIEFILACIKIHIGDALIKEHGDLARIFNVIKQKTNVDYFELDANEAYSKYEPADLLLGS